MRPHSFGNLSSMSFDGEIVGNGAQRERKNR
jgi:hypothetical protein